MTDETSRVDHLIRILGQATSRRTAVGALVAGAALQLLPGAADENDRKRKERRRKRQDRRQDRNDHPRATPPQDCDVCATGCRFASVQAAVDAATAGDTIRLCAGEHASNRSVLIGKNLTLVGAGLAQTHLQGGGFVRVLDVQPGMNVTLRDLSVRGGVERPGNRGGGGGILVRPNGALTLQRCHVTENSAPSGGGIELREGSALTLIASEVSDNDALTGGGGIQIDEGATATLKEESRISDNRCKLFGGGINIVAGTLILEGGASVSGNEVSQLGGGISASSHSTVTLQAGSQVTRNSAKQGGGGLHTASATITIADSAIVTNNDPNNCAGATITNCVN